MALARMLFPLFPLFAVGSLPTLAQNTTAICRKEFDWVRGGLSHVCSRY